MMFNAGDCAVEGLRVVRRHPGAFAIWCLFYLIFIIVLVVLLFAAMASVFLQLFQFQSQAGSDPAVAAEFFKKNWPLLLGAMAFVMPAALVWSAMMACAVYRAVLRPDEKGSGYLRLGGDEFRMIGLYLLIFLIFLVAAAVIGGAGVGLFLGLGKGGWSALACVLLGLVVFGLYVLAVVRLSLCAAQTFAERHINLFGSWRLTRNHFWELFGMYLLVFVILIGVQMANWVVQLPFHAVTAQFGQQHDFTMAPLLLAGGLVSLVLTFVLAVLNSVISIAPKAAAYRALAPRTDQADAFS